MSGRTLTLAQGREKFADLVKRRIKLKKLPWLVLWQQF
jgi:hypothetical protein